MSCFISNNHTEPGRELCISDLPSGDKVSELTSRGKRFSCTPYYPDAPHPANPVPPVRPQPNSVAPTSPPDLVKKFARQGKAEIWESIQYMDHEGMDILREPAAEGADRAWSDYLARTKVSGGRSTGDLCPMPYVLCRERLGARLRNGHV